MLVNLSAELEGFAMKVNEIITEVDWKSMANKMISAHQTYQGHKHELSRNRDTTTVPDLNSPAEKKIGPETDISKIIEYGQQLSFPYPEEEGIDVIIRRSGYYLTRVPQALATNPTVKPERKTGLVPVKNPTNIAKLNTYYDNAADAGNVTQSSEHAL